MVVPTFDEALVVETFLEVSVDNFGISRIGKQFSFVFCRAGHGDEKSGTQCLGLHLTVHFFHQIQRLLMSFTDGHDDTASFGQLIDQRLRNVFRRTRNDDLVERSVFGPALIAVTNFGEHVLVFQLLQYLRRAFA